jgi:hypothetical protein
MRRFVRRGSGQYGEGDLFLGIKVTPLRRLARGEAGKLLASRFYEALLVLVRAFEQAVYDLYLANTTRVNNWDLVDSSAPAIVGGFLAGYCPRMPRTMLRYAIERFPEARRRQ